MCFLSIYCIILYIDYCVIRCPKQKITVYFLLKCCFVIELGFGEASPEAKAAKHLHDFFTYVAVRIVSAQLEVNLIQNSHLTYSV